MKRLLISLLLTLSALGLAGCWPKSYSWHQKLTVTVVTPSGEVSGSSVIYEKVLLGQMPAMASGISYTIKGEATVVEVAPGKYLFALLSGLKTEALAATVFRDDPNEEAPITFDRIMSIREVKSVPSDMYPMLVTFTDINDPKSVKEVKPGKLAEVFGAGYALKSVTVEITDEVVSKGLNSAVLPWLANQYGLYLDGRNVSDVHNGLSNNIGDSNFRTEK